MPRVAISKPGSDKKRSRTTQGGKIVKRERKAPRGLSFSWMPKSLSPAVHKFSRCLVETIPLINAAGATPPTNWSITADAGMVRRFEFQLNLLPEYTDFTNLFSSYRITHAEMTMFFGNTGSDASGGNTDTLSNRQVIMYAAPNRNGRTDQILDEPHFLENQTAIKKLCYNDNGTPVTLSMPLSQLSERFSGVANTDYAATKPAFISTGEPGCPHYGVDIRFQRVDNSPFSAGGTIYPYCKLITKLYFECKQVS